MKLTCVPLPSGLQLIVDVLLGTVASALCGFRRGGAFANRPPFIALSLLTRLTRIVRYAFLIAATRIELPPLRPRSAAGRIRRAAAARLRGPAFQMFPGFRIVTLAEIPRPVPAQFLAAGRDPWLTAGRRCQALREALADPLPIIRRMARALPRRLMVFGWRPPKRPPPTIGRTFWEEMVEGYREARFQVGEFLRRRRDSGGAPASVP